MFYVPATIYYENVKQEQKNKTQWRCQNIVKAKYFITFVIWWIFRNAFLCDKRRVCGLYNPNHRKIHGSVFSFWIAETNKEMQQRKEKQETQMQQTNKCNKLNKLFSHQRILMFTPSIYEAEDKGTKQTGNRPFSSFTSVIQSYHIVWMTDLHIHHELILNLIGDAAHLHIRPGRVQPKHGNSHPHPWYPSKTD